MQSTTSPEAQAERAVLALLVQNEKAYPEIVERLSEDDFITKSGSTILKTAKKLKQDGTIVDAITLGNELKAEPLNTYILELAAECPSFSGLSHYAKILKANTKKKKLHEIAQLIQSSDKDPDEVMVAANRMIDNAMKNNGHSSVTFKDVAWDLVHKLDNQIQPPGYNLSYKELRRYFRVQPGKFYICGARPGMGKTTMGLNWAMDVSRMGKNVMFFSIEMPKDEIVGNMLSLEAAVNTRVWQRMVAEKADVKKIMDVANKTRGEIIIDDGSYLTPDTMEVKIRRQLHNFPIDLVVVDYVQLMRAPGYKEDRVNEMGYVSNSMKRIARALQVPIFCLAQLNRSTVRGQKPTMSDLRESGSFEQDADVVMLLYRPDYFDRSKRPNEMDIIVGKNRAGPVGTVTMDVCLPTARILTREVNYGKEEG